jgi:hypothetical protein
MLQRIHQSHCNKRAQNLSGAVTLALFPVLVDGIRGEGDDIRKFYLMSVNVPDLSRQKDLCQIYFFR